MKNKTLKSRGGVIFFVYYWLPVITWASIIFLFSSHPTRKATEIFWQDFVIKKLAHIVEYAVFTMLLYRALKSAGVRRRDGALAAVTLAILYGMSDEFHQSFTPGREPTVRDVFFDSLGSVLSIYFIKNLPRFNSKIIALAKKLDLI